MRRNISDPNKCKEGSKEIPTGHIGPNSRKIQSFKQENQDLFNNGLSAGQGQAAVTLGPPTRTSSVRPGLEEDENEDESFVDS